MQQALISTCLVAGLALACALVAGCGRDDARTDCRASSDCDLDETCISGACIDDGVLFGGIGGTIGTGGASAGDAAPADATVRPVPDASDAVTDDANTDGADIGAADAGSDTGADDTVSSGDTPVEPVTECADLRIEPSPVFVRPNAADPSPTVDVIVAVRNGGAGDVIVSAVDAPVTAGFSVTDETATALPATVPGGGSFRITLEAEEARVRDATLTIITSVCALSAELLTP